MSEITVGLFGTCGASTWRKGFRAVYDRHGINYFDPQVAEGTWDPDQAQAEAWHLANDSLVLFPITDESYAVGSLAEAGFSSSDRWSHNRFVVIYVAPDVSPALHKDNPAAAQGSKRARRLVLEHLSKAKNPNVLVVDSLAQLLDASLKLYAALKLVQSARDAAAHAWEPIVQSAMWQELSVGAESS